MSQSPFARAFITSAFVAGAVFTASTFPLAMTKSKVVDIELQNQTIFSSEMKDLSAPYLAFSAAFSVALGFGIFGIMGWQHAVRKLAKFEGNSSDLAHELAIHRAELERIKFSESRLKAQNLSEFLPASHSFRSHLAEATRNPESAFATLTSHAAHDIELDPARGLCQAPSSNGSQVPDSNLTQPLHPMPELRSESDPKGEAITSLLQQLNQLSQQVEKLRDNNADGLAA